MHSHVLIVAPHGDDEIIGCFELIEKLNTERKEVRVLYPEDRTPPTWTANPLCIVPLIGKSLCGSYLDETVQKNMGILYVFPDPVYETHPTHRKYGALGENLLRKGLDVMFYSVNMQAPYIREVKNPGRKKEMLNLYYSDKSDLWEYDHKYFLFEGQCQWVKGW